MKYIATIFISLVALVSFAQKSVEQSGTPALLESASGKKARVNLQGLDAGMLVFKPSRSPKNMTIPADKIKRLTFSMTKEAFDSFKNLDIVSEEKITEIFNNPSVSKGEKLQLIFNAALERIENTFQEADYDGVLNVLEPILADFRPYMAIENNLQESFCMQLKAYWAKGDFAQAKQMASILEQTSDPKFKVKAQVVLARIALVEDDFPAAEKIIEAVEHEAAKLYLQACFQRAKGELNQSIQTVSDIIVQHGNDLEWLPQAELLGARIYLDLAGLEGASISTNSAIKAARQVKNMYAGTNVAADARMLWVSLGGEPIEAAEIAERELQWEKERKLKRAAKKAKQEREKARKKKKKAKEAAKAAESGQS